MKLYIGTTKDDELVYLEWDKAENEQKKYFSICGGTYNNPKTEEEGEKEARERLEDYSYWEDIGYLGDSIPEVLRKNIDFVAVADEVLMTDGWTMINGEFYLFGEHNGEDIYLNDQSGGQHKEEIENFKHLWINKEILKDVYKLWDEQHLKPLTKEAVAKMEAFFEQYKKYCSDQEALNKYLKDINY